MHRTSNSSRNSRTHARCWQLQEDTESRGIPPQSHGKAPWEQVGPWELWAWDLGPPIWYHPGLIETAKDELVSLREMVKMKMNKSQRTTPGACHRARSPSRTIAGDAISFILVIYTGFFSVHLQRDANHGTNRGTPVAARLADSQPRPKHWGDWHRAQ
jgi:hypothetical protein